jgi:putative membrane protein
MKRQRWIAAAAAALGLLAAGSVLAWQTTPSASPSSGMDKEFMTKAAQGGMMEVKLGQLAEKQAASSAVKQFGRRMVRDHSRANAKLKLVAQKENTALPQELAADQQQMVDELSKLSGAAFDRAYMSHMVQDHQEDIELFNREAHDGQDPAVKAFASRALPTLRKHLQLARSAARKVGATTAMQHAAP